MTVCFTGHRHIDNDVYLPLQAALMEQIEKLIAEGATVFRTGGAMGFDTMAGLCVLSLRKKYPHIRLELYLPCPTQTRGWRMSDKILYEQILSEADAYKYISPYYFAGVLQMRNRALVEGAEVCLSYLHHSHGGGTAYTAALAAQNGLRLINFGERF